MPLKAVREVRKASWDSVICQVLSHARLTARAVVDESRPIGAEVGGTAGPKKIKQMLTGGGRRGLGAAEVSLRRDRCRHAELPCREAVASVNGDGPHEGSGFVGQPWQLM